MKRQVKEVPVSELKVGTLYSIVGAVMEYVGEETHKDNPVKNEGEDVECLVFRPILPSMYMMLMTKLPNGNIPFDKNDMVDDDSKFGEILDLSVAELESEMQRAIDEEDEEAGLELKPLED